MDRRIERMQEALREVAAEFLAREAGHQSLITVTRAEIADGVKSGKIYLTVFPDTSEAAAVAFANRNRREFGEFFRSRVRGVAIPHVEFIIDRGEKNRQRLDELSS